MLATKTSNSENLGVKVSNLLDRFALEQGWNIHRTTQDEIQLHKQIIAFWIDHLKESNVPTDRFNQIYARTIKMRAQAKREGKFVSVKLTPEDFIAAWEDIQQTEKTEEIERRAEMTANLPETLRCKQIATHFVGNWEYSEGVSEITAKEGLVEVSFGYEDEYFLAPCFYCRNEEYSKFLSRRKEKQNRVENAIKTVVKSTEFGNDDEVFNLGKQALQGDGQALRQWQAEYLEKAKSLEISVNTGGEKCRR